MVHGLIVLKHDNVRRLCQFPLFAWYVLGWNLVPRKLYIFPVFPVSPGGDSYRKPQPTYPTLIIHVSFPQMNRGSSTRAPTTRNYDEMRSRWLTITSSPGPRGETDFTANPTVHFLTPLSPFRQCMCCFRNAKNFERFNLVIQAIICLMVSQLRCIESFLVKAPTDSVPVTPPTGDEIRKATENQNTHKEDDNNDDDDAVNAPSKAKKERFSASDETGASAAEQQPDDVFSLSDVEQILIMMSKAFLLNFPLYVAYKHSAHPRLDDLSANDVQALGLYCDLNDNEIPVFLLRNVTLFCSAGGFSAMTHCFEQPNLPVPTAHAITATLSNIKLWLNYQSILKLFYPLRVKVLQYMCGLTDLELRTAATKAMAEFMWTAIKDPLDAQVAFDTEGLALAFKYFTSTTLTMRLSGIAQINAHINVFNEICTSETIAEIEVMGQKLADWLTEHEIIQHLFGPNMHIEVIKQSHIVLNFLAVENHITEAHVTLIWQAAQSKHCSKAVYDILPALVKNLAPRPALHLYALLCRLDTKEHSEQSIFIVSALTKLIWSRESCRANVDLFNTEYLLRAASNAGINLTSSTDNSLSIGGGNNSDEDPAGEEYSSTEERGTSQRGDSEQSQTKESTGAGEKEVGKGELKRCL